MFSTSSQDLKPSRTGEPRLIPPTSPSSTTRNANNNSNDSTVAAAATATPSIAVFLFAKEKLLFRYPDTDPFVVDVATSGGNTSGAGGGASETVSKKAATGGNNSHTNTGGSTNNSHNKNSSANGGVSGRGEMTNATTSAHSSSSASSSHDRHRRGNSKSGRGTLHPDFLTATTRPTTPTTSRAPAASAIGGGGGGSRLKKKSPHVHVTLAADVKDHRGGAPHGTLGGTSGEGGGNCSGGTAASSTSSTAGVAPQRGMRRPMSAYALVNDNLNASLAVSPSTHGHRTGSPSVVAAAAGGGSARFGARRSPHMKTTDADVSGVDGPNNGARCGIGGVSVGPTTQVQNTLTGSTRRTASSPSSSVVNAAVRTDNKSGHLSHGRATPLQQQQQQYTGGTATCVGISTNALMHLLRGALNGCTTINMVNCTFLVFPLTLATSGSSASSTTTNPVVNTTGDSESSKRSFATYALNRQRLPSRSATALLVVAMKQPDTDSGAIANFAQCFVNVLCREEQRCHYVSNELDRMEMLTNHWEVGGAAAVASAAEELRQQQEQWQSLVDTLSPQHCTSSPASVLRSHSPLSSPRALGESGGGGCQGFSFRNLSSSPHRQCTPTNVDSRESAAAVAPVRPHSEYDYLFASPRPAVRRSRSSTAAATTSGDVKESSVVPLQQHRTSSDNVHGDNMAHTSAHREASPNGSPWAEMDCNGAEVGENNSNSGHIKCASHGLSGSLSSTRATSPFSGRDGNGGGLHRRNGPTASSTYSHSVATNSGVSASLYQQLAAHVRLASEVQQVAQCIDLWNRTSRVSEGINNACRDASGRRLPRVPCSSFFGGADGARAVDGNGGGGSTVSSLTSTSTSAAACGRARNGVAATCPRDPFRRYSNVGTSPQQQQQQQQQSWVTAAPGEALDALPDAILVNQMLLLPLSHLTGKERLEQVQTMRSAYSRIHPCSVVTLEETQFTENLQRSYVDTMGRRYAKLIPLATVYALLLALPSPRRAGSLYRSIELTLLEAVQRRHARAAAAAGNNNCNSSTTTLTRNVSAAGPSASHTLSAGSYPTYYVSGRTNREELDEHAPSASAVAAAAATTAAGLDFLAMEIIDFLRVNGAITVASEMWVCFTHGEITPVQYVEAAVQRRRRHRLRAERRHQHTEDNVADNLNGASKVTANSPSSHQHQHHHHHHGRCMDRHQRTCTQAPELQSQSPESTRCFDHGDTHHKESANTLNNSSYVSSEITVVETDNAHGKAPPTEAHWTTDGCATAAAPMYDPFEDVKDIDTVPAALVLHMLERVVDEQHLSPQTQQDHFQEQQQQQGLLYVPASASVVSVTNCGNDMHSGLGASRYNGKGAEMLSNTTMTAGAPTSPSTSNTTSATGAVAVATGGMARTPRSSETDTSAGRASYKARCPLNTLTAGSAPITGSFMHQQQQQQQQQGVLMPTHSTSAAVSAASSPLLHYTGVHFRQHTKASAVPTAQLSVYCAWGSACPLCEQLASHPQCWTTTANKGYTAGHYLSNTSRHLHLISPLQLNFPSLDASVCACALHARRLRSQADLSSLMQNSYSISGGGSLVGQRAGGSSGFLHSLQPWFIRPHMFVTPVTAAFGVSPFEIFERMYYHSIRGWKNSNATDTQRPQQVYGVVAGVPVMVPVNNTSSLIEPEWRDMLSVARTQATAQNTAPVLTAAASAAASRRGAVVGAAEEQGHTLLQSPDIPAGAVDYLRRCAEPIRRRLAYSRSQQSKLIRFEQACALNASSCATVSVEAQGRLATGLVHQSTCVKGSPSWRLSAATENSNGVDAFSAQLEQLPQTSASPPSTEVSVSEGVATPTTAATAVFNKSAATSASAASPVEVASGPNKNNNCNTVAPVPASLPISNTIATQPTPVNNSSAATAAECDRDNDERASSLTPAALQAGLSKPRNSTDVRPRSIRYGRRQLPLHTTSSPMTNVNLLFNDATPPVAVIKAAEGDDQGVAEERQLQQVSSTSAHADPLRRFAVSSNSGTATTTNNTASSFPYAGVNDLLEGDRSLPVEVLLQYVLHHLIALCWGRRGVELDTLVRLLERNLRRLPPLLTNLQYVRQLRNAGFTSESAAAAVASARAPAAAVAAANSNTSAEAATANGVGSPLGSVSPWCAVSTVVHTRLAAVPFGAGPGKRPSPSNLTDTPEDNSDTSPLSGGSRAATAMPITESEVQLLQAYEVLEKLSLMDLLSSYATWAVRTVPTRLLLHTVVNEFCDVLYVDCSEREEEVDHWDLPVAAQ